MNKQFSAKSPDPKCFARTDDGKVYAGEVVSDQPKWGKSRVEGVIFDEFTGEISPGVFHNGSDNSWVTWSFNTSRDIIPESPIVLPDIIQCAIYGQEYKK